MSGCCDRHCRTWDEHSVLPERHCYMCSAYWADWVKS